MMANDNKPEGVSNRAKFKRGESLLHRFATNAYHGLNNFSLPIPMLIAKVLWESVSCLTKLYYWAKSAFWVTPLFKGACHKIGRNLKAGTFLPYVVGSGKIYLGENIRFYGKQNFLFSSIRDESPEIHIGDDTTIGHDVVFDIAGKLIIGKHCLIASGVTFVDCGGHSIVAEKRAKGEAPTEKDVRDITIGDNVWIGTGAYIFPGTTIGDNCVISANTPVGRKLPANSLVSAAPSKAVEIRDVSKII